MGVYDYHQSPAEPDEADGSLPLYERHQEVTPENPYKAYVEVNVDFAPDGVITPRVIFWEDGRRFVIDRVSRVERGASARAGGAGIRFVCEVRGRTVDLYYEENGLWFVTRKIPRDRGGQKRSSGA